MNHYGKYLSAYLRLQINAMSSEQLVLFKEAIEMKQETLDPGSETHRICQAIILYIEEHQQLGWLAELLEDLKLNDV